jgi:hypothetical protein
MDCSSGSSPSWGIVSFPSLKGKDVIPSHINMLFFWQSSQIFIYLLFFIIFHICDFFTVFAVVPVTFLTQNVLLVSNVLILVLTIKLNKGVFKRKVIFVNVLFFVAILTTHLLPLK